MFDIIFTYQFGSVFFLNKYKYKWVFFQLKLWSLETEPNDGGWEKYCVINEF